MKTFAAVTLWGRSLAKKLIYVEFVGDGDSATELCKMGNGKGPYGTQYPLRKDECMNHVSKKLVTRL